MKNIYEQIAANQRKSFILIVGFIAFITGAVYSISLAYDLGPDFVILAAMISFITSFLSYFYSDKISLSLAGATPASPKTSSAFYSVTQNLSQAASLPMPKLFIIPSPALNAFATGRDPKHASVAITQGLLDRLDRTQLEGVIGHELAHVKNRDTLIMTMVVVLIGVLSLLIDFFYRTSFFRPRRSDNDNNSPIFAILGILAIILAPLIANLIKLAISRRREFYADAYSAKLTRYPEGLVQALTIISQDSQPLATASTATAHLFIENPLKNANFNSKIANLFSTHPPVTARIKALRGQ